MEIKTFAHFIETVLEERKAEDILVIDVEGKTVLADYFVICSATSPNHVRALLDEVDEKVEKEYGLQPKSVEGTESYRWVLIDYGDVIVHIFHHEDRAFYNVEKLWQGSRPNAEDLAEDNA